MSTQTYSQSQESLVPTYAPFSSHPPRLASLVGGESVAATGWGDLLEGISEGSSQTSTGGGGQVGKSGVSGMTMDERGEGSDRRLESLAQSVESRKQDTASMAQELAALEMKLAAAEAREQALRASQLKK